MKVVIGLSLTVVTALSVWFTTTAIASSLADEWGFSQSDLTWLAVSVQLGFVAGAVIVAVSNLSDLYNTRHLVSVCAVLAAVSNAVLLLVPGDLWPLLGARFATGLFLGGVYPPAMKILAGWFKDDRGLALGIIVGALVLGSGSPHLINSVFVDHWRYTVGATTALALAGALVPLLLIEDGPYDVPARQFKPTYVLDLLSDRSYRLALIGYLGHMWELYAMWVWLPAYLRVIYGGQHIVGVGVEVASAVSFLVFGAGTIGCIGAGYLGDRVGRIFAINMSLAGSGTCSLLFGFVPEDFGLLIAMLAVVWGVVVVADSAQLSAAITELSNVEYRGTALTFQTAVGFLLSIASIQLFPLIESYAGWGTAFAMLAIGPAFGIVAMLNLRAMPEAQILAGGKR